MINAQIAFTKRYAIMVAHPLVRAVISMSDFQQWTLSPPIFTCDVIASDLVH